MRHTGINKIWGILINFLVFFLGILRKRLIIVTGLSGILLAGYVAQYYLPAPTPKIVGIDLGTTYSSIAVYHPGTGEVEVIGDKHGRKSFPSIITYLPNGTVVASYESVQVAHENPLSTVYDAKRFIGKHFEQDELINELKRYPFKAVLDEGNVKLVIPSETGKVRQLTPEEVGATIIRHLVGMAQRHLDVSITKAVISVPAEFDDRQRNATKAAASLAGIEVLRIINEPTAAALAYGLHKKDGVDHVLIVDLGGGTLDISILLIEGGMFLTRAMAGNNHLGGQDFTERLLNLVSTAVKDRFRLDNIDAADMQTLRQAVEDAKLELTYQQSSVIDVFLDGPSQRFRYLIDRPTFERINEDLFLRILKPIAAALKDTDLTPTDISEIVLVGGSTRIPRIREIISEYFHGKIPNYSIDPELAVVSGVAVQAGVIGGAWPLQVSATELPAQLKKIHVYDDA